MTRLLLNVAALATCLFACVASSDAAAQSSASHPAKVVVRRAGDDGSRKL